MSNGPEFRRVIAQVSPAELAAITAIRQAYMACNATDLEVDGEPQRSPLVYEVSHVAVENGYAEEPTAMGLLAQAGRTAWRQVGITDVDMWEVMGDSGEDAAYVYGLYVRGDLVGRFAL